MGEEELQLRLRLFGKPDEFWKTQFFERSSNFPDIVKPNVINIIDFLEIHDNFFEIGGILAAIHAKLGKGIAVVAIQKPPGRDLAKGGYMSLEKPRLYLALSNEKTGHRIKIVKAKNYAQKDKNPNGLSMFFTLRCGNEINPSMNWCRLPAA